MRSSIHPSPCDTEERVQSKQQDKIASDSKTIEILGVYTPLSTNNSTDMQSGRTKSPTVDDILTTGEKIQSEPKDTQSVHQHGCKYYRRW